MFTIGSDPLLAARLRVPQPPAPVLRRPHLVERLRQAVERPLTLVAAPAGFGKTTLLATWLEQAALQAAWLTLEQDDDDLSRFWAHVFTALERVQPGSGAPALALLLAPQSQRPVPIETILAAWINRLATLPRSRVLVLDDYHLITAPPIHQAVAYLIDHLPPQFHLVIATRADPPLPLGRLRAHGLLAEIRAADLRFNSQETAAFLTRALGPKLSSHELAALAARTEGWIAGLQLAALAMLGRTDISDFLKAFTGSHRYIIDYLVEEVLARQPPPVQTFLLQTAILERLQGSLCAAVMSEPGLEVNGQAMLEELERANLFLTPLDEQRLWFRYHQLFAEALRHRLQLRLPGRVHELHRRASIWYAQQGQLRDAVHHALAAADFEQAARLMEQAAHALVQRGEITTLQRWVDALPAELVRSRLEISVWQGWLLFVTGQLGAAERHLEELERRFAIHPEPAEPSSQPAAWPYPPAEILGRIAAIRASIAMIQRDLPRAIALSQQALDDLPRDNLARAYVAWYLGKAHWLSGDIEAARLALAAASRVSWELNHLYVVFLVSHDLAQLQIACGHLHQADQIYRQALERALALGGQQPALGPAYVGRGELEREWNHLEAARALFQQGIQFCDQTGNAQAILQATIGLAFIQQAQGDPEAAGARMRQALLIAARPNLAPSSQEQAEASQARLWLIQGDEAGAWGWVQRRGLRVDQALTLVQEPEALTLIRVLIRRRQLAEAARWLTKLLPLAQAQGRLGSVIEILMLQAELCHASGDVNQALEPLAQALSLAEPEGYMRLFVDEGPPLAQLLASLRLRRGLGPPALTRYREQLLAVLGAAPDGERSPSAAAFPESGPNPLDDPLSERELEVLRLIVAGCSNREIADRLVIALSTVKWYVNALYGKLQVKSRTQAIARARALNIA